MVSTTIIFKKDNVQPPVFVAGGFTDWSPVEMTYETTESNGSVENVFFHKTQLEPGEYQYKFRLGPGDWWVLDESAPKGSLFCTAQESPPLTVSQQLTSLEM
jgi:1,4-alpha-glucan branching enzyme